jgi:hypothetical protein
MLARMIAWLSVPAAFLVAVGCSLINAPDQVRPGGTGGDGGESSGTSTVTSGSSSSSSGSSSSGAGGAGGAGGGGGGGGPMECSTPADCAALNGPCTYGACVSGKCVSQPTNENSPCDDGLFCTSGESCQQGKCVGGAGTPCPPQACATVTCDENTDSCSSVPVGCVSGDGCCPAGCGMPADTDCCKNPGGGSLTAENGTGQNEWYCYDAADGTDVRARKACESHFGVGACCVISGGYNGQQYGQCGADGGAGTIHWHWDNHPDGHCDPVYKVGDVVSPGWCGSILGNFLD